MLLDFWTDSNYYRINHQNVHEHVLDEKIA